MLDLVRRRLVQMQMITKSPHVARLLPDDLDRRVFDDAGTMGPGTGLGPDIVLGRLADAPYTGIALAGRAKQLQTAQPGSIYHHGHSAHTALSPAPYSRSG